MHGYAPAEAKSTAARSKDTSKRPFTSSSTNMWHSWPHPLYTNSSLHLLMHFLRQLLLLLRRRRTTGSPINMLFRPHILTHKLHRPIIRLVRHLFPAMRTVVIDMHPPVQHARKTSQADADEAEQTAGDARRCLVRAVDISRREREITRSWRIRLC